MDLAVEGARVLSVWCDRCCKWDVGQFVTAVTESSCSHQFLWAAFVPLSQKVAVSLPMQSTDTE